MCLCIAKKNSSLPAVVVGALARPERNIDASQDMRQNARDEKAWRAKERNMTPISSDINATVASDESSTRSSSASEETANFDATTALDASALDNGMAEDADSALDSGESEQAAEATPLPIDPARAAFLLTLQRAKEGDRNAFEEIYNLYHRRIYNAVYGMLSDADDAQDVTQDVFIRLHDALPTLRADEAFSTYLYRIALNLCRDRARRKKRVRFQSIDTPRTDSEGDVEPMDFPDTAKLPEEALTNDELQTRVREAVQTLSVDHKAVIVMHHFQGMEVNDIADILKVPTGTVKSRLARGRDQLHRKLRTYLGVAA